MKKILLLLTIGSMLAAACLGLTGCDSFERADEHTHTFAAEWSSDQTHHWHAATCSHTGEVRDKAEHVFADGVCSVCGKRYEEQQTQERAHTAAPEQSGTQTSGGQGGAEIDLPIVPLP